MNQTTDSSAQPLALDDLVIGKKFRSHSHQLNAAEIIAFGRQFDPQPFHVDEEAAQKTFFGGLAASGWHTAAISMRLLVLSMPILGGLIGAGGEISWPKPTRPGDTLHVEAEVLQIVPSRSRTDRGMVTFRTVTRNQNGEAVQILTSRLVVPRRAVTETTPPAKQDC